MKFLQDENWVTRRHAAYLIGDTCFASSLEDKLLLGPFKEDTAARSALLDALKIEKEDEVLRMLIMSLGQLRDPSLVETINGYMTHKEEYVRRNVVQGLSHIPHESAVKALIESFNDEMGSIRQASILGLSSKWMGSQAFDKLIKAIWNLSNESSQQICCLETIARYLNNISDDESDSAVNHRKLAYLNCIKLVDDSTSENHWSIRGYAYVIIGLANQPGSRLVLERMKKNESHPFALGKLDEAIENLTR